LLALLGAHHILHVSRIRVNVGTLPANNDQTFAAHSSDQTKKYKEIPGHALRIPAG
jgi:hypothetical protein